MKLNKICKKVMAYTLTTAMALGFFAVSDINLTTAWAADAISSSGVLTIDGSENTLNATINIVESGNANMTEANENFTLGACTLSSITLSDNTLTLGANGKIVISSGVTWELNTNKTIKGPCVIEGNNCAITASGITGGTITGGTITGASVSGGTVKDATLNGCTLADANITLDGCSLNCDTNGEATDTTTTISCAGTNYATLKLKGNEKCYKVPASANLKLDVASSFAGKLNMEVAITPQAASNATDIENDGAIAGNNIAYGKKGAGSADDWLLTSQGINLTKGSASGTDEEHGLWNIGDDKTIAASITSNSFFDKMRSGNITVKATATSYANDLNKLLNTYKDSNGKIKLGLTRFACTISGNTVEASVSPTNSAKYGKKINIPIQSYTEYRDGVNRLNLVDSSGFTSESDVALYTALRGNTGYTYDDANYVLHFPDSYTDTVGGLEKSFSVSKKNIGNRVHINSGSQTGADTDDGGDDQNLVPGDVYVEVGTYSSSTITEQTDFESTWTPSGTNVKVKICKSDRTLEGLDYDTDFTLSTTSAITTSGNLVISAKANSTKYTGSITVPIKIYDKVETADAYTGDLKTITSTGTGHVYSKSAEGTFSTTRPQFEDAGVNEFYYKESANATEVKKGAFIIPKKGLTTTYSGFDSSTNFTYDGKAKAPRIVVQDTTGKFQANGFSTKFYKKGTDNAYRDEVNECVNVNNYKVEVKLNEANEKNYKLNPAYQTFAITQATECDITAKDVTAYGSVPNINPVTVAAPEGAYRVYFGKESDSCTATSLSQLYTEKGTYKVYYRIDAVDGVTDSNVSSDAYDGKTGSFNLTIKDDLTVQATNPSKSSVTYNANGYELKGDAYCGSDKVSGAKVTVYGKNVKTGAKATTIKAVGNYTLTADVEIDGYTYKNVEMEDNFVEIKAAAAKKNLSKATVSVKNVTYNANKQTAKVTVKYGKTTLKLGTDYTLKNATHINAGSFKVTITGKGNYTGTKTVTFKIAKRKVTKGVVTVKRSKKTYTVYVKIGKKNYKAAKTNYKLTSKYNKKTKKYAVTVAFKVNYSGTVKKTVK